MFGDRVPHAPSPQEQRLITPLTEADHRLGMLSRIHLGNFIRTVVAIELPTAVVTAITGDFTVLAASGVLIATVGGNTIYDAHNYYRKGIRPDAPFNRLIKATELDRKITN